VIWTYSARTFMGCPGVWPGMLTSLATGLLQASPLTSPPALLVGLVVLAVIMLVGRVLLALAWRLVVIAAIAVAVLWILGILGFETGLLGQVA
jgi:hypothetical protein